MPPALIDTHCHLDDPRFAEDFDAVLERAVAAGVTQLVTIGCAQEPTQADQALALAKRFPDRMRATAGVHPHDARHLDETLLAAIERVARDPLVVAVGETGLDFHYHHSPTDAQTSAFRRQIALAREIGKPLVIHTREAPQETLSILREENARDVGGIIHCFSEDAAFAKQALDLGFVSSFSGIVTFGRRSEPIRQAAQQQPADAILVETDAPYLAPAPHRGKRNEPAFVADTARALAQLRGEPEDEFRARTTQNARRVLRLD